MKSGHLARPSIPTSRTPASTALAEPPRRRHLRRCVQIAVLSLLVCSPFSVASASVMELVFDNSSMTPGSFFGPGCCALGVEVTLGGKARKVRQISLLVDNQNVDVVADLTVALYANDGIDGAPGTPLWFGGPGAGVAIPAQVSVLDIAVPDVLVPDVVTIVSLPPTSEPVALGRLFGGTTTVGVLNAAWLQTDFQPPPSGWTTGPAFAVRVYAVPEPSAFPLLAAAAAMVLASTRRRPVRT